jgi:hypothetical protein
MKKNWHITWHLLLGLAAVAGFGAAVLLLWNVLIPTIFGLAAINFWQALGLLALCRILFGGFGHGRHVGRGGFYRNHIHEKWHNMSDEERREFLKNRRFGHDFFNMEKDDKKD